MGRRVVEILTVLSCLFFGPGLFAQTETGIFTTGCTFEVHYTIQHPTCPEEADGTIDLEILNADGMPSIYWIEGISGGGNGSDAFINTLAAGNYQASIGDESQCYDTLTFVLNDPLPLTFELNTNSSCPQENNGSVTVNPISGNADSYSINGGTPQNEPLFSALTPGQHTIRVFDPNGCFYEETVNVPEIIAPVITFAQEEPTCPESTDASFIVIIETVSNNENYEYSIDGTNFQADSTFEDLIPGAYEVFIRNDNLCVFTEQIEVFGLETPEVNFEKTDVTCPNGNDASFIVIIETVSNNENYEYSLDGVNFQQDSLFEELEANIYQVYMKNEAGCIFEETVFIDAPESPEVDFEIEDVSCPDGNDASFIVIIETVSNNEDYEYSIDGTNFQADSTFTELEAGVYEVFTRASTGCVQSNLVEVQAPIEPHIDFEIEDVSCPDGNDASFIVIIETVSNNEVYEYSIDGTNFQPDSTFTDLDAGVYEVFARNDVGCVQSQLVEVVEPEMPELDFEVEDVNCPDGNDASFIVIIETVSNHENYEYSLDNITFQEDSTFYDLAAGVYEVFARNEIGCTFSELLEVDEPETPEIDIQVDDTTCPGSNDASFIVIIETVSNNENYEFSINGNEFQEDSTFYDLAAGVYDLSIRNERSCLFHETVIISAPEEPSLGFEIDPVTCSGGNDASFIVIIETVSNSQNYEFSIDGTNFQEDSTFTDLEAGIIEVSVRNAAGCISTDNIVIEEPTLPMIDFDIDDVTCPGGTDASLIVIIEPLGNTEEDWDYSLNGINYQADSLFTDLDAGVYNAYVRSENNCVYSQLFSISEPDATEVTLASTDVSCPGGNDGIIAVTASGASSFYEYSLDGLSFQTSNVFENLTGGIYQITVRNANACTVTESTIVNVPQMPQYDMNTQAVSCNGGSDGSIEVIVISGIEPFQYALNDQDAQESNIFEQLTAGTYNISLIDANACIFTSPVNVFDPPQMNALVSSENETCDHDNGWIALTIEGGTGIYQFNWANEEITPSINELTAGTYRVSVTDQNNCLLVESITIINEPAPDIEAFLQDLSCYQNQDGWIDLDIHGVAPPFNINWSNGEQSDHINDLSSGEYGVTVSDQNNCLTSAHFILEEPEALSVDATITNLESGVNISLQVSGGEGPYTFEWSSGQGVQDLQNVPFGFYDVVVTDANGCEVKTDISALDPELPVDGSIQVYPTLTTKEVNIDIQLSETKPVNVYLVDEMGRLVQVLDPSNIENQIITMDLESLAAAVYFLRIEIGEESIIKKVVKVVE